MITHLHTHSYYSLLEGLLSPEALIKQASSMGMTSLALTDHTNLTGAIEFYLACQAENIKPILGLELDIDYSVDRQVKELAAPLLLLARDIKGWANLCWLSSCAHDMGSSSIGLSCPIDALNDHTEGLTCLSGGTFSYLYGLVRQNRISEATGWISRLSLMFADHFYVELQISRPGDNSLVYELARLAHKSAVPVIATQNIYYLNDHQVDLLRVLTAIRLNKTIDELQTDQLIPDDSIFIDEDKFRGKFSHLPMAIENIQAVVEDCHLELPIGMSNFPKLSLPEGMGAIDLLRQKAFDGAAQLYGTNSQPIRDRIEHELQIIGKSGYEPIFLVVEELLAFARKSGVLFSSRGSAASSLVAHCLGITSPDPLKLDLYFERFLNPARTTPPDIDTDICSRDRDKVIQHVFDVYGLDRVAMVGTINTYRPRSALSDVAKAFNLPRDQIRRLVSWLPYRFRPNQETEEDIAISPFSELLQRFPSAIQRKIIGHATEILGFPRHLSMHAGGIVISPGPMTNLVPTQPSGQKGITITQFDLVSLEHLGLVKIDLLGIRGLTVLGDVIDSTLSRNPRKEKRRFEFLESIPIDDDLTSDRIENGRTIGCFQIESPGMRNTLKEINARTVDDIMAALALYRPGPLKGGYKDAFVRRHKGLEPIKYLHPSLTDLLKSTHGVILYQEQVLRIAHEIAGLSIAASDLLRRAMSHFDPGKQLELLRESFIRGAWEKSQVNGELAAKIWDLMAAFAGYGFPKAHAASYAMISWRSAWCKSHFPAAFMAAVLANWGGYYSQRVYLTEAKRMGLGIHPPHINFARREFSVVRKENDSPLYMGLDQVKDLTRRTQQKIIRERPFSSLTDFLSRVDPRFSEAESLIKIGGLAGFGTIPDLLTALQESRWRAGQYSLFDPTFEGKEDWSLVEKVTAQKEILGIEVDAHPIELVLEQLSGQNLQTSAEIEALLGERARIVGIRQTWQRTFTGNRGTMAYLTLEDLEGMVDVVVPPNVYNRCKNLLFETRPIIVEGIVEMSGTQVEPVIKAEKIILPV